MSMVALVASMKLAVTDMITVALVAVAMNKGRL